MLIFSTFKHDKGVNVKFYFPYLALPSFNYIQNIKNEYVPKNGVRTELDLSKTCWYIRFGSTRPFWLVSRARLYHPTWPNKTHYPNTVRSNVRANLSHTTTTMNFNLQSLKKIPKNIKNKRYRSLTYMTNLASTIPCQYSFYAIPSSI